MKCFVNWIPVNTHVRSNKTLPYSKTQETVLDCRLLFLCLSSPGSPRVRAGAGPLASSSSSSTSPRVSKIGTRGLYWAAQTKLTHIIIVAGPLIALIGPKIKNWSDSLRMARPLVVTSV